MDPISAFAKNRGALAVNAFHFQDDMIFDYFSVTTRAL